MVDSATAGDVAGSDGALSERNKVFLLTLVSIVLVWGGHHTWRGYHRYIEASARRAHIQRLVENSRRQVKAKGPTMENSPRSSAKVVEPFSEETSAATVPDTNASEQTTADGETRSAKQPKRSKERRRRGRDVRKEVLKTERKRESGSGGRLSNVLETPDCSTSRSVSVVGSSRSESVDSAPRYEVHDATPRPEPTDWTNAQDSRSECSSVSASVSSLGVGVGAQDSSQTSDDGKTPVDRNPTPDPPLPPATTLEAELYSLSTATPPEALGDSQEPLESSWKAMCPASPLPSHDSLSFIQLPHVNDLKNSSPSNRLPQDPRPAISSPASPSPQNSSLSAQIKSYKNALELSRVREERLRREANKYKRECDTLRYHWNQDVERRKRRETDLESQLKQMRSQLQSLSLSVSQIQMQPFQGTFPSHSPIPFGYPPSGISSPGSSSMPFLQHPHTFISNDSHARFRSASSPNTSSPARVSQHNTFVDDVNSQLAEAILKRPDRVHSFTPVPPAEPFYPETDSAAGSSRSGSVVGRATRDGFTFASLSELGNPQPKRSQTSSPEFFEGSDFDERNEAKENFVVGGTFEEPQNEYEGKENSTRLSVEANFSAVEPAAMGIRALSAPGWHSVASDDDRTGENDGSPEEDVTSMSMERAATYGAEQMDHLTFGMLASA